MVARAGRRIPSYPEASSTPFACRPLRPLPGSLAGSATPLPLLRRLPASIIVRFDATFDWRQYQGRTAPATALPVGLCLAAGLFSGHALEATLAAGGAIQVGFAAYKRVTRWREAALLLTAFGVALSAAIGTVAARLPALLLAVAIIWSVAIALVGRRYGDQARWVVLQCAIALVVASGFPSDWRFALQRGALVFVGGAVQVAAVTLLWWWRGEPLFGDRPSSDPDASARAAWIEPARMALVSVGALSLSTALPMHNAYWVPMVALLVMRPTVAAALQTSLERTVGTLLGAGLATALVALTRPGPLALVAVIVGLAWLTYALQSVNFTAFMASLTALIALVISLNGFPEAVVALHRVTATVLGALIALLVGELFELVLTGVTRLRGGGTDARADRT
ncbi:FUSC family protein [Chitinasiproducens palmae]|nr:FUSC family protein [Chitinasiproducens palmae]